ncbi:formylglycine-generating enzyme family protein [candidate division KSB1 bacterium]|nr:formylglycine-generating enzyme family protein [candidate division KSB1 bacterium]
MLLPTANTIVLEPLLRSHRIKQVPAQFVEIPGGTFVMGDSSKYSEENEQPVHPVSLAGFRMSRYEITNQQYCDFLNSYETTADSVEIWIDMHSTYCQIMQEEKEFSVRSGYKDHPVATISWYGAHAYARWLSEQFEGSYRLPTEAEWEYACRAGTKTQFNTGDSLTTDQANFQGERYIGNTIAVGSFLENAWGLYNMHGNVWEWCQDEWHVNYEGAPKDGRAWQTGEGSRRVLRGGGWSNYAQYCRSAYRSPIDPGIRIIAVGFRLVFVPQ